jgi:hypothetical protein
MIWELKFCFLSALVTTGMFSKLGSDCLLCSKEESLRSYSLVLMLRSFYGFAYLRFDLFYLRISLGCIIVILGLIISVVSKGTKLPTLLV